MTDISITGLTDATSVSGADTLPIVQGGVTKEGSMSHIKDFTLAGLAAGSVAITPTGNVVATDTQSAIAELDGDLTAGLAGKADDAFTPTGGISATTVHGAIAELEADTTAALANKADAAATTASLAVKAEKTVTLSAASGVSFAVGEMGYVEFDTEVVKPTNASAATTSADVEIVMATEAITAGGAGAFCRRGEVTGLTGLVAGAYYLGTTDKTIATAAPSTTGQVIRVIGRARTATKFYFNPDPGWSVKT